MWLLHNLKLDKNGVSSKLDDKRYWLNMNSHDTQAKQEKLSGKCIKWKITQLENIGLRMIYFISKGGGESLFLKVMGCD